jgi:hypothetical protein
MNFGSRRKRLVAVWVGLITATALSCVLCSTSSVLDPRDASVVIVLIAFIKIRYVIMDFMELRSAPLAMRIMANCWLLCASGAILLLYLT